MNILIAIDSYKGTIDSIEGSKIIASAIKDSGFKGSPILAPMADGGENSIAIVKSILGGEYIDIEVMGPCLTNIDTHYLLKEDKAYIEVALVAGYSQMDDLSILNRTSEGLGMAIIDAINKGAKEINLFLGGSATSDLGLGMLSRLGVKFLDKENKALFPLPEVFEDIERIDIGNLDKLKGCRFNIICDVTNPLLGPNGTSYTYAKQKGASLEEIEILEKGATHIAEIIYKEFGDDIKNRPYYGCSGGIAMASSYFLNADIHLGSEYFSSLYKLGNLLDKHSSLPKSLFPTIARSFASTLFARSIILETTFPWKEVLSSLPSPVITKLFSSNRLPSLCKEEKYSLPKKISALRK
ncbi:MAG: glycerate kinase [Bacilli bacterium]|nr:glycerate kinase [Bacilli bacterium]